MSRPVCVIALAVFAAAALACEKPPTTGEAIPWADVATGTEAMQGKGIDSLFAPACKTARKGDGKVYYAEGYPHWAYHSPSLCRNDDCNVELFQNDTADGEPLESPVEGHVGLLVKKKFVDEPNLENTNTTSQGVAAGKTVTTSGRLVKDSLALHLSDDTTVNNRVRIRAFFKIVDHNGVCELQYVGGVKATGPAPPPPSAAPLTGMAAALASAAASASAAAAAPPPPSASAAKPKATTPSRKAKK